MRRLHEREAPNLGSAACTAKDLKNKAAVVAEGKPSAVW